MLKVMPRQYLSLIEVFGVFKEMKKFSRGRTASPVSAGHSD